MQTMIQHSGLSVLFLTLTLLISCGNNSTNTDEKAEVHPLLVTLSQLDEASSPSPNMLVEEFTSSEKSEKSFIVKGVLEGSQNDLIVLNELTPQKLIVLDSVRTNKGKFKLSGNGLSETTLCYITINSTNPPGVPIVLENGSKVRITINNQDGLTYSVKGDVENERMHDLYELYTGMDRRLEKLNEEVKNIDPATVPDSVRKTINDAFGNLNRERNRAIKEFIQEDEGTLAVFFAATYLHSKPIPSLMASAYEKLAVKHPNSQYGKELKSRLDRIAPLSPGALAPEISLTNTKGDTLKLSDLRGQVVLIDFWASWCGPCRRENPNVLKLYQKYHEKGFEIFGVSLDKSKSRWIQAIEKDGLAWKHVSDLKGWKSSAAATYNVHSIPHTVLIDQDGRIIESGLRSHQLEPILEDLLR